MIRNLFLHKIAKGLGMLWSFFERLRKEEQGCSCANISSSREMGANVMVMGGGTL